MSLKLTMTEAAGFDLHESDEWIAGTITAIEETEGQYGPGLKWIIGLDGEEWDVWAFCSQKLSPKSKVYGWLKGLDPQNVPEAGDTYDFGKLVDKRVEIMFEQFDDDGQTREKVSKIRAEKKQAAIKGQQKAAARAKTGQDDDDSPF